MLLPADLADAGPPFVTKVPVVTFLLLDGVGLPLVDAFTDAPAGNVPVLVAAGLALLDVVDVDPVFPEAAGDDA